MTELDHTHDAAARSWVESANKAKCDFPVQNLPFAVFRRAGSRESFRGGVAIGDQVLDLAALSTLDVLKGTAAEAPTACGPPCNSRLTPRKSAKAPTAARRMITSHNHAGRSPLGAILKRKPQPTGG
jgi:hypothetical protein